MINRNYIYKTVREHAAFLIFAFLLVGAFQVLMLTLVIEADILNLVQIFLSKFPPQFQQFMGEEFFAQFSINGALAFGYNHPNVLIFIIIIAIMLPGKHIAGEIEGGTMELLLSLPLKRTTLFISLWITSAIMIFITIIGCWLGTLIGLAIYPQIADIQFGRILMIGINLWLLMLAINGYSFLISAYSKEGGRSTLRAAGITLFFFFLNYTAKLWADASFLKPATIFSYYQPQAVMMGKSSLLVNSGVLAALTLVFLGVALRKVSLRDIP